MLLRLPWTSHRMCSRTSIGWPRCHLQGFVAWFRLSSRVHWKQATCSSLDGRTFKSSSIHCCTFKCTLTKGLRAQLNTAWVSCVLWTLTHTYNPKGLIVGQSCRELSSKCFSIWNNTSNVFSIWNQTLKADFWKISKLYVFRGLDGALFNYSKMCCSIC